MAENDCGRHGNGAKKLCCCLLGALLGLILLVMFILFLIWLIYRPTKPQFILKDATFNTFNFTPSTDLLTSSFQITLFSRNPNNHFGIYYDNLFVFATYKDQQITQSSLLFPTYQGRKEFSIWSPLLTGDDVVVAPYIRDYLTRDHTAGTVLISIKVSGNFRIKEGASLSGKNFHLSVSCPLFLGEPGIKYQLVQSCNTLVSA